MGWQFCLAEMRQEFQTGGNLFCATLYDLIHTERSTLLLSLLGDEYDEKGKLIRNDLNLICHAN